LNFHYTAKPAKSATQALFAGANISVINMQLLVLPCSRQSLTEFFYGFVIFLTALCQLSLGFLNRLANPISMNCNYCGLALKKNMRKRVMFFNEL